MPLPNGITSPASGQRPLPPSLSSSSPKENDGSARALRRKRMFVRVGAWVVLCLLAYQALWTYWLAGVNVPDIEIDKMTGQKRIRRRPEHLQKYDNMKGMNVPTHPLDGIMEGYLSLVSIYIPSRGLVSSGDQKYTGVRGTFCALSWRLQENDPSKVPMFKDLRDQSPLCEGTTYTADLWDIARKATDYDHRNHTFAATKPRQGQGPVPPTGVVFHETRCGSTLVANLLASFKPKHVRVYSESPPPVAALRACMKGGGSGRCDPGSHDALIRDVFYLMGRITCVERPQYVFYKIQSIGTHAISAFTRAMPEVPWMFIYRNSVEIMMSHFKNFQVGHPLAKDFYPVCLRDYGTTNPNPVLKQLVEDQGATVEQLTKEEFCAAHLASLAQSATNAHDAAKATGSKTPNWFVNYEDLPHRMWDYVMPKLLGVDSLDKDMISRMQHVGHSYSKGRGPKAGMRWHEDSTMKQGKAPEVVKQAAAKFLDPVYQKMESIRKEEL